MQIITVSKKNDDIRDRFFRGVFGKHEGYVAVAAKQDDKLSEDYFRYPSQLPNLLDWINATYLNHDLYYSPMLLGKPKNKRENVEITPVVWADFDGNPIDDVKPAPSVIVESSPHNYHLLWFLQEPLLAPLQAENASRRIAYTFGADTSGWDLHQLLRIPITHNYKYDTIPQITISKFDESLRYTWADFEGLEDRPEYKAAAEGMPSTNGMDAAKILNNAHVPQLAISLFHNAPEKDWSSALWALESMLFESGLKPEEVFVVVEESAVNKYRRDSRPREELWLEVCKAKVAVDSKRLEIERPVEIGSLLTEIERRNLGEPTFVERYIEWAQSKTDAAPEYHQAGAFVILSSILSDSVTLPTSAGNMHPNLWFMLLGDTTLTRKTTAMNMAMRLLTSIRDDALLATDASIEGLMTELSLRPNRSSVFWRDEFSGMLESMKKREYYSGMVETLAKLYDGERQKRILRKETIDVQNPRFILFAGGIKSRILELFDAGYVINGFVPRFIFITAEADKSRFRKMGPPTQNQELISGELLKELNDIWQHYDITQTMRLGTQQFESKKEFIAKLTPDAWDRYNQLEEFLVFMETDYTEVMRPTFDRLCKSTLKASVLLAASRQRQDVVLVELPDVLRAISYLEKWIEHSVAVVINAGKTMSEKTIDKAMDLIRRGKNTRASLMRSMHLSSRDASLLIETIDQRGLVIINKSGKEVRLHPA